MLYLVFDIQDQVIDVVAYSHCSVAEPHSLSRVAAI